MHDLDLARFSRDRFSNSNEYQELKAKIQDRLIDILDLKVLNTLDQVTLRREIRGVIEKVIAEDQANVFPLNLKERERLFTEIQHEVLGYGPLEPFLNDSGVSDIFVNTYKHIFVERRGKIEYTEARFKDNRHLRCIIDKITSSVGRRVDESCPMVDARLPDGSRVNVIIPPLALDGPMLSIRRFPLEAFELDDLIDLGTVPGELRVVLEGIVRSKLNILISGGTGSGKTTFLNVLSRFIPPDERIITIEDSAELQMKQFHVIRLETRPANIEGKGEIVQRDLLRNSLRMRPDRIIIGEVRGQEALDMLQAMNTGHDGSLGTIHANSPRDAIARLETIVAMSGVSISTETIRRYISSAINIVIHLQRLADGSRKLVSFQEITGMEGNTIALQEILSFEQTGFGADGRAAGSFRFKGIVPRFMEKFKLLGIPFDYSCFDSKNTLDV